MPQTRVVADALSVVTICLVVVLVLLGSFCIIYSIYFRSQIHDQGRGRFKYFSGPWIIKISFVFFFVWWGIGEIFRLNLLRRHGRVLGALNLKWQENICKCYIVSNLGFAEPCLFLTLIFLLRSSLQRSGALGQKWNAKIAGFVLLCCFPIFTLQLLVILVGPTFKDKVDKHIHSYFILAHMKSKNDLAICTYPLLSTLFLGLFVTVLAAYMCWLGMRISGRVINKGLRRRVCILVFSIFSSSQLRVVLLGLSVLLKPEKAAFDAIIFLAFLCLVSCVSVGICILVYLPVADSLALMALQREDTSTTGRDEYISLIANQAHAFGRRSGKEEVGGDQSGFLELSLSAPSLHLSPLRSSARDRGP